MGPEEQHLELSSGFHMYMSIHVYLCTYDHACMHTYKEENIPFKGHSNFLIFFFFFTFFRFCLNVCMCTTYMLGAQSVGSPAIGLTDSCKPP